MRRQNTQVLDYPELMTTVILGSSCCISSETLQLPIAFTKKLNAILVASYLFVFFLLINQILTNVLRARPVMLMPSVPTPWGLMRADVFEDILVMALLVSVCVLIGKGQGKCKLLCLKTTPVKGFKTFLFLIFIT